MTQLIDPRVTFGEAVTECAAQDDRVVVVSADSGFSSGFKRFAQNFPDRYYEVGIQEHAATGLAAGLATTGKVPVFAAIAAFVTCRNFEAFRNDIGYMAQNVKIVGRNGGMTYSNLGPTHYSLEDYALVRMIPGVVVLSPQDSGEIREATKTMLDHHGPVYMRIGGPATEELFEQVPFVIGEGSLVRSGDRATVVSTGPATAATVRAVDELAAQAVSIELIAMPTVEPVDAELILASAQRTGLVITVEEHFDRGGLSSAVADALRGERIRHRAIGVPHTYITTGTYSGLNELYGLDAASLTARIGAMVEETGSVASPELMS